MSNFKSVVDFVLDTADLLQERSIKFIPGSGAACVLSVGHPDRPSVVVLLSIDPDEVWGYVLTTQRRHRVVRYDADSSIQVDRFIRNGQLYPLLNTTAVPVCLDARLLLNALSTLQNAGVPLDNVMIRCGASSPEHASLLLCVSDDAWNAHIAICGTVISNKDCRSTELGVIKFNGIPLTEENWRTLFFRERALLEEEDEEELIDAAGDEAEL